MLKLISLTFLFYLKIYPNVLILKYQIFVSCKQEDNNSLGQLSDRQDRYSISDNGSHTGRFFYDDDGELIGPGEPQWLWISAGIFHVG